MQAGPWQLILIALVVLVLFGRGRISEMMGDFGKGIKSFKQGLNEDESRPSSPPPAQIAAPPAQPQQPAQPAQQPESANNQTGGN